MQSKLTELPSGAGLSDAALLCMSVPHYPEMSDNTSQANARRLEDLNRKVDQLLTMMNGTGEDNPGVMGRLAFMERVLFGKEDQERGLLYKVNVMYRVHFWLVGLICTAAGFGLRELVHLVWKV